MTKTNVETSDKPTYRITLYDPFEMFDGVFWDRILEACINIGETTEYETLDRIADYLDGDIPRDEIPAEFTGFTDKALKNEYSKRFPILLGKALQSIGRDLETGEVRLVIEYPETQTGNDGLIYEYLDYLHMEIGLRSKDVAAIPLSGSADEACSEVADKQYVIDQFTDVSDEKLFEAVRSLCDEPELTCRKDAIEYIVWVVACTINDR